MLDPALTEPATTVSSNFPFNHVAGGLKTDDHGETKVSFLVVEVALLHMIFLRGNWRTRISRRSCSYFSVIITAPFHEKDQ